MIQIILKSWRKDG